MASSKVWMPWPERTEQPIFASSTCITPPQENRELSVILPSSNAMEAVHILNTEPGM